MPSFLLELFSEEIPARMQQDAAEYLRTKLSLELVKQKLLPEGDLFHTSVFVTPRRLAIFIKDLPAILAPSETELKGPKVGAPEAALQGFLKKNNLQQKDLTEKDGIYFAVVRKSGQNTADLLKPIIEDILVNFPWPKSMRWGSRAVTWVRPLHSILCIFDGKIVPVEFGGVKAGNATYGHRFHAPASITIAAPEEYETKLKAAFVIADFAARREEIRTQTTKVAATKSLTVKPDERLLDEVTGLVEWPTVIIGTIDANYMDLPPEVLTSEMRAHQKYFALHDAAGKFSAHFLITSNNKNPEAVPAIIAGNERVLRARLADGRFYWDQDRKVKLNDWAKKLDGVTFHAKIGTIAQKVERIAKLAVAIAEKTGADPKKVARAAELCKADLTTGMVGEFPELQGVMGRYYALQQNESAEVADAIRDHYLPLGPDSAVPTEKTAICVALADKLDTLVSMFAAGEKPTGSKDPFALRRAALGVIRIILENDLRISFKDTLLLTSIFIHDNLKTVTLNSITEKLLNTYKESILKGHFDIAGLINELEKTDPQHFIISKAKESFDFFLDRLKVQLKDQGIRHDIITAALDGTNDDDLVRLVARVKALETFLKTPEGTNLLAAAKRAQNIVAAEAKKDKKQPKNYAGDVDSTKLTAAEEKTLAAELQKTKPPLEKAINAEDFAGGMKLIAALRPTIDAFFEKVLVNEPEFRANRLRLLTGIDSLLSQIADFSKIEG